MYIFPVYVLASKVKFHQESRSNLSLRRSLYSVGLSRYWHQHPLNGTGASIKHLSTNAAEH